MSSMPYLAALLILEKCTCLSGLDEDAALCCTFKPHEDPREVLQAEQSRLSQAIAVIQEAASYCVVGVACTPVLWKPFKSECLEQGVDRSNAATSN